MNFYSEDIINHIIDTENIENIVDEIETFYKNVFMTFCYYSNTIVNPLYIRSLLENKKNKIIFRCIDTYFNIDNCPSQRPYYNLECLVLLIFYFNYFSGMIISVSICITWFIRFAFFVQRMINI